MAIRDIAGNLRAKQMFLSYAGGTKQGTAFMIAGEENTGKNFAALQFAKVLNCLNPSSGNDCCDECDNCRMIDRVLGSLDDNGFQQYPHPDAVYITTEKAQLSIELMRGALTEAGAYRALKLRKKIVIVNDAERMNAAASNSILKALEEPNPSLVVILIVNNPEKILPTILSRCQAIEIKRAPLEEIRQRLIKAGMEGAELKESLMFCEGKIGEAFDHVKLKDNAVFTAGLFRAIASKEDDVEGIFKALDVIDEKRKEKKKARAADGEKDPDSTGQRIFLLDVLITLACIFRDLMLLKLGVKNVFAEKYGLSADNTRDYSEKNMVNILRMIETAQRDLMMNANISLLFSGLFFNIRKEGTAK